MKFALITKSGKIVTFFLEETAEIYRDAYGGTIFLLIRTEIENKSLKIRILD